MTHLKITDIPNEGKRTKRWVVRNAVNDSHIGYIGWFTNWRRYCFFTLGIQTVLDPECMRELADFCEGETMTHNRNLSLLKLSKRGKNG